MSKLVLSELEEKVAVPLGEHWLNAKQDLRFFSDTNNFVDYFKRASSNVKNALLSSDRGKLGVEGLYKAADDLLYLSSSLGAVLTPFECQKFEGITGVFMSAPVVAVEPIYCHSESLNSYIDNKILKSLKSAQILAERELGACDEDDFSVRLSDACALSASMSVSKVGGLNTRTIHDMFRALQVTSNTLCFSFHPGTSVEKDNVSAPLRSAMLSFEMLNVEFI